ncbi:hypothetical protein TcasGA2_TC016405 [Tribolium castaneum]|uniref:Uncharacterized protein n=1 Tax=Tribolium castaneum TaxID=7070 RepID=D7EIX4_TRICA|nr:hypothetical protein TcasGA2_TC016405 [Tribolium castaneum]
MYNLKSMKLYSRTLTSKRTCFNMFHSMNQKYAIIQHQLIEKSSKTTISTNPGVKFPTETHLKDEAKRVIQHLPISFWSLQRDLGIKIQPLRDHQDDVESYKSMYLNHRVQCYPRVRTTSTISVWVRVFAMIKLSDVT